MNDPHVSRLHLRVFIDESGVWSIEDRSTTGSFLPDGTRFQSGRVPATLTLHLGSADGPRVEFGLIIDDEDGQILAAEGPIGLGAALSTASLAAAWRSKRATILIAGGAAALGAMVLQGYLTSLKYEGWNEPALPFEIVPMRGGRLAGIAFVLLASIVFGAAIAGVGLLRDPASRSGLEGLIGGSVRLLRATWSVEATVVLIAATVATGFWSIRWVAYLNPNDQRVTSAPQVVGVFSDGRFSPAWALVAGLWLVLAALVLADRRSARPDNARVPALVLGLGIGSTASFLIPSTFGRLLFAATLAGWIIWRKRRGPAGAAAAGLLLAAVLVVGASDRAAADDGGWVECGSNPVGMAKCAPEIIPSTGYPAPAAAMGGAAGAMSLVAAVAAAGRSPSGNSSDSD